MLQLTLCTCYRIHSNNKEKDINHYQLEKEEGKCLSKKQKYFFMICILVCDVISGEYT